MTNVTLAQAYLRKAIDRLDILDLLLGKKDYSDVIREAQEIVELALKGMLRHVGVEPPKIHDVGDLLLEYRDRFGTVASELAALARISKRLRHEREFAFYGDIDFIPTEEYSFADAQQARDDANRVVTVARRVIRTAEP
jgi:HEPN domain-containing protein